MIAWWSLERKAVCKQLQHPQEVTNALLVRADLFYQSDIVASQDEMIRAKHRLLDTAPEGLTRNSPAVPSFEVRGLSLTNSQIGWWPSGVYVILRQWQDVGNESIFVCKGRITTKALCKGWLS